MTILSIQPTWKCNYNCDYCYLGYLRKENKILPLGILQQRFEEIIKENKIEAIDIFGGEIGILDSSYLENLVSICYGYFGNIPIRITSNCSNKKAIRLVKKFEDKLDIGLAVSWNLERKNNDKVELEILNRPAPVKNFMVLVVALPSIIFSNIYSLLNRFQSWNKPVTILRYFPSIYNENPESSINDKDYTEFMKELISAYRQGGYTFPLINLDILYNNFNNSPLMETNIFLTPSGEWSWVNYKQGKEYFVTSSNLEDWKKACEEEKLLYKEKCGKCRYYNKCLAEHLNFDSLKEEECCGLRNFIDWRNNENIY